MIKEGLPHPSCLHLSIVTCPFDQHNDVLQRISKNEHQIEEKRQRNDSPLNFVFYVRAWYVFYTSDPPFLQISLFFMHLHQPPKHRTSKYRLLLYCPFPHCLTEYLPTAYIMTPEHRILDNRTTAYQRTTDFQLTAYLHRLTAYQRAGYQSAYYCLTVHQLTDYRSTDHQFTDYQSTDHQSTDYQSTDYLFTDYQSTDYEIIIYQSTDYQSTDYRIINYRSTDYQPTDYPSTKQHCTSNLLTEQGPPFTRLFPHFSHPPWLVLYALYMSTTCF